jgi:hypothetical protein
VTKRVWIVVILLFVACAGAIAFLMLDGHSPKMRSSEPLRSGTTSSTQNGARERATSREPTRSERRAILSVARGRIGIAKRWDRCIDYEIAVSRVDPSYAMVAYGFRNRRVGCKGFGFNGQTLYRRVPGGWKYFSAASSWDCSVAPEGVISSFTDRLNFYIESCRSRTRTISSPG